MVTDPDGTIRYMSPSVKRVLGYRPEEMVGTNSAEYAHPDDIERAFKELEVLLSKPGVHPVAVETRVRHKDNSWRHLEGIASNLLDDPAVGGLVFNHRDVTDRVRAEEEIRRLNEELESRVAERTAQLEAALSELRTSEERYRLLVESASDYAIFMVDAVGRITNWSTGAERLFGYREEEIIGKPGSLLFTPGDVRSGAPEEELREAAEEGRAEDERWHVRKDGSRFWASGIVRPIRSEDGTLRGFTKAARDVTERKRAMEVQRFLAEAGEALSSSLDYRTTLASVAYLAVPTLADWCAVDVVAEDGSVERLAVAHPDPKKVELAYELQERYPTDPDAPYGIPNVLRTGEPEMMEEIPEELIEQAARDEGHREMLRELGLKSYMVVPLAARGRTLGAISFVSAESGRRYGQADLDLAQELARRAGLAVDNARLYEEAHREIAERRWAQEELQRSREQLEVILRGVADGIVAQNPSGHLVYANEAAARMSGYSSAREFVNAPLEEVMSRFELLDAEGRPFPLERLPGRRALMGEEGAEETVRFRVIETGEERWSVVRATPVFDEERGVRLAVSIMRDITEQRRAEQEQARLAAIVESSEDAIIGKTLEGIITSWNRGAERIYGYSAEEIIGRPITTLVPPERPEEIPNILKKIRRGEKVEHYETVRVTKDGRRLNISLTISPIRDSTGNIVGASTIARDITERKRMEGALQDMREAERQRIARDLHDGVLQDLSYITAALGLIMLDAEGTSLEEELQRAVDAVRRAAQGLRDAVNDLRLTDELDRPFPRLVESLVERNSQMARSLQIELKVQERFPSEPLGETGTQVLRIIQEALTNARRHSGAKSVVVTVGMEGYDLIAGVADDGRGFGSGVPSGVGLNSMGERAAAISGKLEIESEVGQGTRVWLRVPIPQKG
jgi:PAS domain S-box-containing protein